MAGYNRVIMVGNLTRDPELKQLPSGQAVCKLSIATNRQFKNRQTGAQQQEVCYIDVDVWGPQAESSNQYLQKGKPVLIEGRLKLDTWKDTEGQTRSKHSIVADRVQFLSGAASELAVSEEYDNDIAELSSTNVRVPSSSKQAFPSSKPSFKDEPPFEDLPF